MHEVEDSNSDSEDIDQETEPDRYAVHQFKRRVKMHFEFIKYDKLPSEGTEISHDIKAIQKHVILKA